MLTVAILSLLTALAASNPIPARKLETRGPPLSDGVSVLDTANKYRAAYGLNALRWDDGIAAQAQQVGIDNGGVNEVHEVVNTAQVITPGPQINIAHQNMQDLSPFETAYLSGWLCEVPTDPQISSVCPIAQNLMPMMWVGTGHHDILTDASYNTLGCAFTVNPAADPTSPYQGLWVCNLGF